MALNSSFPNITKLLELASEGDPTARGQLQVGPGLYTKRLLNRPQLKPDFLEDQAEMKAKLITNFYVFEAAERLKFKNLAKRTDSTSPCCPKSTGRSLRRYR